jgi:uncharacterized protein YdeI (YjbR/CyaY-like superfamily)
MPPTPKDPVFFASPEEWRAWLAAHHETEAELWVGFHKRATGRPSLTWPQSVDEALCYGWIDGIRKSLDGDRYVIRFTPRKATSNWSAVNVKRMAELEAEGRVAPAGRRAFAERKEAKTGIYAYEQRENAALDAGSEARFREHEAAWAYYQAQPAWYRRTTAHWVISAKREETRRKRLDTLIADSAAGRPIKQLDRKGGG